MSSSVALRILDETSGDQIGRCTGPAPDGSCPRVAIGDILPCASHVLVPAVGRDAVRYRVSGQATLCPVTLALALAVTPDSWLTLPEETPPAAAAG